MFRNRTIGVASLLLGLALVLSFAWVPASSAQDGFAYIRMIRAMEADETGLPHPAGLAFSSKGNAFYVAAAPAQGQAAPTSTEITTLTPFADRAGSAQIAAQVKDPLNMAFDAKAKRLLILQSPAGRMLAVPEGSGGKLVPQAMTSSDVRRLGLVSPRGLSVDPQTGSVYILDGEGPRLLRLEPGADGSLEGGRVAWVDLGAAGLGEVRGLAFDPKTGHLQVASVADKKLIELTQTGQVVAKRDLAEFNLRNLQGMVIAPSGDQTDDPAETSLFIADAGDKAAQLPGQILEFTFTEPAAPAPKDFQSSIVRITDLAAVSPPSPDPSALTFVPASVPGFPQPYRLVMADGEVEETVRGITHFQGANVWELTLTGEVIRTANISKEPPTVVPMTNEPAGITWNPNNGHFFVSVDGTKDVYDLDPGGDGLIGTSDDSWTSFDTLVHGNGDPEGIAFDTLHNDLYVADGVNNEVYHYTLAGSLLGHFDVQSLGVEDPESVEFNPDSGTLLVMSSSLFTPVIVETTLSGALIQTINIGATNARQAAGLAYAPASDGSPVKRFYIVDRGVDNNDNPNIIDGKMFEMTAPGNNPPVAVDDELVTDEDTDVDFTADDLLANDHDPDGDLISIDAIDATSSQGGTISSLGGNAYRYSPPDNFYGPDTFDYTITDGEETDTATVSVQVDPENDPPVALDKFATTVEDVAVPITLEATDVENDPLTFHVVAAPLHGALSGAAPALTYTPEVDYYGPDNFTFRAKDGAANSNVATVSITIEPGPHAVDDHLATDENTSLDFTDADLLANDSHPDGESLTVTAVDATSAEGGTIADLGGGNYRYSPPADFAGTDSFTYAVDDESGGSDTATVFMFVAVNGPPAADDQDVTVAMNGEVDITLTATDVDGDALTYSLVDGPQHGTLTGSGANRTYIPDTDYAGLDSFTFKANDGTADSNIATVTITVTRGMLFLPVIGKGGG